MCFSLTNCLAPQQTAFFFVVTVILLDRLATEMIVLHKYSQGAGSEQSTISPCLTICNDLDHWIKISRCGDTKGGCRLHGLFGLDICSADL